MAETAVLERANAVHHGRRLEYFTIGWNTLEGLVAVVAGAVAGSVSLVGFGIDSFIEVTSGSALLWGCRLMQMCTAANATSGEPRRLSACVFCVSPPTSPTNPRRTCGPSEPPSTAYPASFWPAFPLS